MKQYTLLTALIITIFSSFSFAQDTDDLAREAADGLCDCVNDTYSNIDDDVKNAMVTIIKYQMNDQQQEMEQYANALSADLGSRIQDQASEFTENQSFFDICTKNIESSLAESIVDENSDITEEQFMIILLNEMSQNKDCKFAYLLIQLGLAETENDNNVNSGTIKSNTNNSKYENPAPKPPAVNDNSNGSDQQGSGGN
jgi:hypothetical protein